MKEKPNIIMANTSVVALILLVIPPKVRRNKTAPKVKEKKDAFDGRNGFHLCTRQYSFKFENQEDVCHIFEAHRL